MQYALDPSNCKDDSGLEYDELMDFKYYFP